ncbi:MAG: hypothetical protein KGY99_10005 [Phycisphaerae bacterium]|nr:hypothetical protein [Phycisphaerae bacterium]
MTTTPNKAVCILGMHRSGTSVVAMSLGRLGVDLGPERELMPASYDNPGGFFELSGVVSLNERIFEALGRSWDATAAMPERWWTRRQMRPLLLEAGVLVDRFFSDRPLWGWKDPRTCLTLPLWQQALADRGCELSYVIVCRNPLDIAASLERRNGFAAAKSLGMYVSYTLHALGYTQNAPRVLVSYERFLADPAGQLRRLAERLGLGAPDEETVADVIARVDPALAHGSSDAQQTAHALRGPVREVYRLTTEAEAADAAPERQTVDRLLGEFRTYSEMITSQMSPSRPSRVQVFNVAEGHLSEAKSVSIYIIADGQVRPHAFELPWDEVTCLRFDPGSSEGLVYIESAELRRADAPADAPPAWRFTAGDIHAVRDLVPLDDTSGRFAIVGDDPQVILFVPAELARSGPLQLVVTMSLQHHLDPAQMRQVMAWLRRSADLPPSRQALAATDRDLEAGRWVIDDGVDADDGLLARLLGALDQDRYVLSLSHSDYLSAIGGTEKFLREEQGNLGKQGISHLQVSVRDAELQAPGPRDAEALLTVNADGRAVGVCTLSALVAALELLAATGTARPAAVHLHQLMAWPLAGLELLLDVLGPPVTRVYLHDYATACPQFNLLRNGEQFCGGSDRLDGPLCGECRHRKRRGKTFPAFAELFARRQMEFVAPSEAAAAVWKACFPQQADRLRVVPHQLVRPVRRDPSPRLERLGRADYRPRIAYLGYPAACKGWQTWLRLIHDRRLKQTYDFYVLGACEGLPDHVRHVPVSFVDDGLDAMVQALLACGIDLAFLWSIWSETYSYTAFEAMAANCLILTHDASGNIAVQARQNGRGRVFASEQDLLGFLWRRDEVVEAARLTLQHNPFVTLVPNAQIARETAEGLDAPPEPCRATADQVLAAARQGGQAALATRLAAELANQRAAVRQLENVRRLQGRLVELDADKRFHDALAAQPHEPPPPGALRRVKHGLGRGVRLARGLMRRL